MSKGSFLHLGCGQQVVDGWINVDGSLGARLADKPRLRSALRRLRLAPPHVEQGWPAGIQWHDVRKPLPLPSASAQAVYSSHLVEHLHLDEAGRLFRECHRVLSPGGVIRIVVPDLHAIVNDYVAARSERQEQEPPAYRGPENTGVVTEVQRLPSRTAAPAGDRLNQHLNFRHPRAPGGSLAYRLYSALTDFQTHKWMYDAESLCFHLQAAGFTEVEPRDLFDSRISGIERIEKPDRVPNGGLVVEGIKPARVSG
jgi:SAM-dependent methyltransferase